MIRGTFRTFGAKRPSANTREIATIRLKFGFIRQIPDYRYTPILPCGILNDATLEPRRTTKIWVPGPLASVIAINWSVEVSLTPS